MKRLLFMILSIVWFSLSVGKDLDVNVQDFVEWAVIGAGPAGILSVGLLRDAGVKDEDIMWIDPEFEVGRMGKYYQTVPGNLKTKVLIQFIRSCKTFATCPSPAIQRLYAYQAEKEYPLYIIVEPLQDITNYVRGHVKSIKGTLTALEFIDDDWLLVIDNKKYVKAHKVILASGSKPKVLDYPCESQISLDIALDKENLSQLVKKNETIGVIGSAHSAILIVKYLYELEISRIINFYAKPIVYAIDQGTWVLNSTSGLRGETARWAKEVLEKGAPETIMRIKNTPQNLESWLPQCNKIIYACGFERNSLPAIGGVNASYDQYDKTTGIIAPRLFGVGIAFPEHFTNPDGKQEMGIGLHHFMRYVQKNLPSWLAKDPYMMSEFNELFIIRIL